MLTRFIQQGWLKISLIIVCIGFIQQEIQFSPISNAQETESIRFAVLGDYGSSTEPFLAEVATMVNAWEVDFIITTGDNNYPDGEAETIDANIGQFFHDYIFPYYGDYGAPARENRFFPTIGNHDYTLDDSLDAYLRYFTLPNNERYYDFVWESIHFFMLNSDDREPDGNEADSIQGQWLKDGLAASSATWKVVVLHESPYSSGWHGDEVDIQWPFQEWGADVVLSGHDHHYERIVLDGLPYFVNGSGGDSLREIADVRSGSRARYNGDYGAMLVIVDSDFMRFEFHSINGRALASATNATLEDWLEIDVTAALSEENTVNLGLTTGSGTSVYFSSKEGDYPPELLIKTDEASYTINPSDDTYINSEQADRNYADDETLRLRYNNLTDYSAYLRFDIADIEGTVEEAFLRLYLVEGDVKGGFTVNPVSETLNDDLTVWTEDNLNAENAPPIYGLDEPIDIFILSKD